MANDGQIVFEVTADGRKARAAIKDVTKDISAEAKKWDQAAKESTDNIGNGFSGMLKKIGTAIGAAKIGQKLLEIGKAALQAASDLEEVQNVVDVTFGDSAKEIDDWAKNASKQFGLTETQAKRFASTMGAMMKSSGMAGDEIVGMSKDLAGLAADMASFYNLDFDTAFQKIRSGISGETEPLKQLGINMSVANLEAYALSKGITKAFNDMSQGEQTMLRYQYLMQATADAQGDFARTSDGYANSMRLLQTNIDSLSTKLGGFLVGAAAQATTWINEFIDKLTAEPEKTVLDRAAEIDLEKTTKLAEIETISKYVQTLSDELVKLSSSSGATIGSIADGANKLNSSSAGTWKSVAASFATIDGMENLFGENGSFESIDELADALSGNGVTKSKADAWQIFLGALGDNAESMSKLTGTSVDETKTWLETMAQTAGELSPEDAAAWDELLSALVKGVSLDTDEGKAFVENLAQQFLSMGSGSEEAAKGLAALGYSTDDIQAKQLAWLGICKELVATMPGLSEVIDTSTGEIKGGIPAIREYADEWERAAKYQAELEAIQNQIDLFNEANNPSKFRGETILARSKAFAQMSVAGTEDIDGELNKIKSYIDAMFAQGKRWEEIKQVLSPEAIGFDISAFVKDYTHKAVGQYGGSDLEAMFTPITWGLTGDAKQAAIDYAKAYYTEIMNAAQAPIVQEQLQDAKEQTAEAYNKSTEALEADIAAMKEASDATKEWSDASKETAKTVIASVSEAVAELTDYVEKYRESMSKAVDNVVNGFGAIETPMQKNRKQVKDLTDQIAGLDTKSKTYKEDLAKLNDELNKANGSTVSAQNMGYNLKQQAEYMDKYMEYLRIARTKGVSNEVLAALADGSEESYDYLEALAKASDSEVETINANYQAVIDKKQQLTDELTAQQLTVDDTYLSMAEKAREAVAALDMEELAAENTGKTVEGMAKGIANHVSDVQEAVDAVLAQLNRLSAYGISVDLGEFGHVKLSESGVVIGNKGNNRNKDDEVTPHSYAVGTDYVPHDMLARIHEGEAVLTAEENKVYQMLKNGILSGVDYDNLGGVMRDNIKPGGNVYLDGKIVGSVVSDRQGRSYKSLQRSGWQQ